MPLVADYGISSDESDNEQTDTVAVTVTNAAKPSASSVLPSSITASSGQTDEVLEDFVKKTNYGDKPLEKPPSKPLASEGLTNLRLPAAKGGKVKISIPKLQDSDSDDDKPVIKKPRPSGGAAGFLGSLPAPKNTTAGKEQGRALIPHTLTKKPTEPPTKPKSAKPTLTQTVVKTTTTTKKTLAAYSDDSDEEGNGSQSSTAQPGGAQSNFFSLETTETVSTKLTVNSTPSVGVTPVDTPLQFTSTVNSSTVVYNTGNDMEPTQPKLSAASLYNMQQGGEDYSDQQYYPPISARYEEEDQTASSTSALGSDDLLQNEQFLRLQGKKGRGKEEINFIDVNTEDLKASELELTKNLSTEVDPEMYAHRKKGDGPTGQQKRKHQITYLAFQAKERELELKNQWAANKHTKQQTQAKYGF